MRRLIQILPGLVVIAGLLVTCEIVPRRLRARTSFRFELLADLDPDEAIGLERSQDLPMPERLAR